MKPFLYKKVRPLFLLLILILFASGAVAQNALARKVNVDFSNANINAIVTNLEQQAGVNFYFDPIQFDSASFTVSGQQITIQEVLDKCSAAPTLDILPTD
jgi:hypothetical protein